MFEPRIKLKDGDIINWPNTTEKFVESCLETVELVS